MAPLILALFVHKLVDRGLSPRAPIRRSEWTIIAGFALLMFSFYLVAKVNIKRASALIAESEEGVFCSALSGSLDSENLITIHVIGAVQQPISVKMPLGSCIKDLKSKVTPSAEADQKFFKRTRRLKNGEKIEVPKKTVELKSSSRL